MPLPVPQVSGFDRWKLLALDSVSSPVTKAMYGRALDEFARWWMIAGRPPVSRQSVHSHRTWLQDQGYSPATINQRLAAIRKLVAEASAAGFVSAETAASVRQVRGIKQSGARAGNWLSLEQTRTLLRVPDRTSLRGLRDRTVLALLIGCGLRRAEASTLEVSDIQLRDGRWVIVDLKGKHGRIRTVPVPGWVKQCVEDWLLSARIEHGKILRSIKSGGATGESITPNAIRDIVRRCGEEAGVKVNPHDLRRTCAKLCRTSGGDLEQIQFLLGHASIQTTERYLGGRQNLSKAPNDSVPFD